MGILRKIFNKSDWDYIADFKDGYALAVRNEHKTVYVIDENYKVACARHLIVCLFDEISVKKAINNNCKYLAARNEDWFENVDYYTFLDTQLKEVEGHKYKNILYYVAGKYAIVVEMNGDISFLNGDLKKKRIIFSSEPDNRFVVVNQDYFYVTNEKTLKLVNTNTEEIKEFEGNHIEMVADGEFYKISQKSGVAYYDKNFNFMENYKRVCTKDKQGRIPIILKNGEMFIYHCN